MVIYSLIYLEDKARRCHSCIFSTTVTRLFVLDQSSLYTPTLSLLTSHHLFLSQNENITLNHILLFLCIFFIATTVYTLFLLQNKTIYLSTSYHSKSTVQISTAATQGEVSLALEVHLIE